MPTSFIKVAIHFVWATWDREPLIESEWEDRLYASIAAKCEELNCPPYAINGMADHMHVLLRLSGTLSLAQIAQHLKGASSHLVNYEFKPSKLFRWQGAYWASCVEVENIDRVRRYIINQKLHHSQASLSHEWEYSNE